MKSVRSSVQSALFFKHMQLKYFCHFAMDIFKVEWPISRPISTGGAGDGGVFGQPKWASRKAPRESGCCAIRVVALSVPLSASEFERVTMLRLIITRRRRRQSDFASWPAQQSGTSHIYTAYI
jgi:hypothetical protein